jgi:hypothetical protein
MLGNRRNIICLFLCVNLGIIIISLIYALLFYISPELFACKFKETFHLYCPGCGGSRALTRLLSLDIAGAFIAHPPLFIAILAVFEVDLRMLIAILRDTPSVIQRYKPTLFIIFAASLVVYFVLRNILLINGIDPLGDIIGPR